MPDRIQCPTSGKVKPRNHANCSGVRQQTSSSKDLRSLAQEASSADRDSAIRDPKAYPIRGQEHFPSSIGSGVWKAAGAKSDSRGHSQVEGRTQGGLHHTELKSPPSRQVQEKAKQWITVEELIRLANMVGIRVDYHTLRFWRRKGLVPNPIRGRDINKLCSRVYYDSSLIERLNFIRESQLKFSLDIRTIRAELDALDRKTSNSGNVEPATIYNERLAEMSLSRDAEMKRRVVNLAGLTLGLALEDIVEILIAKKDGQTIRLELCSGESPTLCPAFR